MVSTESNPRAPSLPNVARFFEEKPTIKPLQHRSEQLKAFIVQFEREPLKPEGASLLADLSRLLEDSEWCAAHDAAHDALNAALKMVEQEAYAAEKLTIESLSKAQMVNATTLAMVKNPDVLKALEPLERYLTSHASRSAIWRQCTPRALKPAEGSVVKTLAEALAEKPAAPPPAAAPAPAPVRPAVVEDWGYYADAGDNYGFSRTPSGHSAGCGPDCGHDHGGLSYKPSSPQSASGATQSSSGHYSDGWGASDHASPSGKAAPAGQPHAQQPKPKQVVIAASIALAGGVWLYLYNKAEQYKRRESALRLAERKDEAPDAAKSWVEETQGEAREGEWSGRAGR